jgi:hypothetical protein
MGWFYGQCVCVWGGGGGFESNGFVTKMQPFPIDGHYRMDIISSVSHPRSDSVVPLVLRTVFLFKFLCYYFLEF